MNFLNKKTLFNLPLYKLVLVSITLVLITTFSIIYSEPIFKVLPLYVSVAVMIMQTFGNRYALLLGSLNSVVYAVVYFFIVKIPAAGISALAISFPLQLIGFINWSRKPYGNSTMFKKMGKKEWLLSPVVFAALWGIFWVLTVELPIFESNFPLLDVTTSAFGTYVTILQLLSYIEFPYLNLINCFLSAYLAIEIMVSGTPGHATYVTQSIYNVICVALTAITVTKIYKEQSLEKEQKNA